MRYFTRSLVQFIFIFSSLTLSNLAFATSAEGPEGSESAPSAPNGQLPDTVTPLAYEIELAIEPNEKVFAGVTTIKIKLNEDADHLWLHGQDLRVNKSYLKSAAGQFLDTTYKQVLDTGVARVDFPQKLEAGDYELVIAYDATVKEVPQGLFRAAYNDEHYWTTQFQTTYARQVFPSFDEPRFKQPFQLSIITPKDFVALANSPLQEREANNDTYVRYTFAPTKPLPTYLVAFAVGPYEINDFGELPKHENRDRPLRFRGFTAQGKSHDMAYGLANTEKILTALEHYFDSPYPYEKLDFLVPPMRLGFAMEHPGAVLYDEYFMLLDENSPAKQKYTYHALNAHELAHMWFGNLVTPKWWDDLWLNESFATWLAVKTSTEVWPEAGLQHENLINGLFAMQKDSLSSVRRVRQPIERNEEIVYALDGSITYFKGAALLRMLEQHVGEDGFQAGIRHHMQRFAHATASTEDFVASLAEANDMQTLEPILMSFINQPGVPVIDVDLRCDTTPVTAQVQQSRYLPLGSSGSTEQTWTLPICLATDDEHYCQVINTPSATLELGETQCPTAVHPNPHGAYYRFNMSNEAWRSLITHVPELSSQEALTMVDSLDAALRSGDLEAGIWLAGISALAQHSNADVVELAATKFAATAKVLPPQNGSVLAAQYSRNLFQPILRDLDEPSSIPANRLKDTLSSQLMTFAKVAELRAPLIRKGVTFVESGGDFAAADLAEDKLELALTMAVEERGKNFYQQLLQLALHAEEPAIVSASLQALAATPDAHQTRKLLEHVQEEDFALRDTLDLIYALFANEQTHDLSFQWLQENLDSIFARMPPVWRGFWLPGLGSDFCTTEKAQAWHDFVTSHGDKLGSYERELSNTVEKIETCAALRTHISDAMVKALSE